MDTLSYFAQILVNGQHSGMLYALLAYGYVVAHCVTHRANLAHGALFALSGQVLVPACAVAYSVYILTFGASLGLGVSLALLVCAAAIYVLASVIVPRFVGRNPNMMIVATLAFAIVLMELARLGSDTRDYWLPPILSDPFYLGFGSSAPRMTQMQAVNMLIGLAAIATFELVVMRGRFGLRLRSVADDPKAAALLGVDAEAVTSRAVWMGSCFAVLAGFLAVLHFGNMSFGAGLVFGLKILFLTAAGGFASPLAAAVGGYVYGLAESLWDGYFAIAVRDMVFLSGLSLLLVLRNQVKVRL
jgi:branched-chain amino acid transport system permease protein